MSFELFSTGRHNKPSPPYCVSRTRSSPTRKSRILVSASPRHASAGDDDMTTTLFSGTEPLLLFLAKATLVLILAIGASFVLRRSTAGERHLVWLAALVG